jgi:cell division GTPase FtsZ
MHATRWGIIASGQGANRIAFLYYARYKNPSIADRVLLLNTTPADVKPESPLEQIFASNPEFREEYEKIKRERVCIFGRAPSGAGNNWVLGEREAMADYDNIRRYIANLKLRSSDVLLGIATLGGGTGNGSLPYIIHRVRKNPGAGMERINNFLALGILPYDFEAPQRHFNTICGLSRLLRYNGEQNAALVILVDNSQVERVLGLRRGQREERYQRINQEIIKTIHMLIAPSSYASRATIDIADYYQLPSNLGMVHFTPCLSLGNDPDVLSLDAILESASTNAMVPLDKGTATMAYIVVIAPEEKVANGEITQEDLEDISREWAAKHLAGSQGGILRYTSLIASPESKSVDAMILLGGFSLRRIMEKSLEKYYDFKDSLSDGSDERSRIELERVEKLEKQLKEYIALTEEKIARLENKSRKAKAELRKWGLSS